MKILIKVIESFHTERECMEYIERKKLDNVMVEKNIFSGRWNILDLS